MTPNEMDDARDCIFCRIAAKKLPAKFIFEDDLFFAIEDSAPQAPVHILVIPKKHIPEIRYISSDDSGLMERWFRTAMTIAKGRGLEEAGYRTVINNGSGGGQTVSHIHIHLLSGRKFHWPPG
ncbi:MAG: histidine triad nucleotide-binding protein [Nitrospiraceae bacterium]|nr:histidine triad nucleotide-binding protein [Nitrospiraceae bacterium]